MKRIGYWVIWVVFLTILTTTGTAVAVEQPPGPPDIIIPRISANPSAIIADGQSTSTITALFLNGTGVPQTGANAYFTMVTEGMGNISTNNGYIDGIGWLNITDSNGRATATFIAGTNPGDVEIMVTAGDGGYNFTIINLIEETIPSVTNASAIPGEILLEEADNADYEHMTTRLNVTVTDASGVGNVTVDLSSIGGSAFAEMTSLGDVYSITTNATGMNGIKSLSVNATDIFGNSNTSVNIVLNVFINGDVNGDGNIDFGDSDYIAGYLLGVPGYETLNILASDVNGDGNIDFMDSDQIAGYLLGVPGYEKLY